MSTDLCRKLKKEEEKKAKSWEEWWKKTNKKNEIIIETNRCNKGLLSDEEKVKLQKERVIFEEEECNSLIKLPDYTEL